VAVSEQMSTTVWRAVPDGGGEPGIARLVHSPQRTLDVVLPGHEGCYSQRNMGVLKWLYLGQPELVWMLLVTYNWCHQAVG